MNWVSQRQSGLRYRSSAKLRIVCELRTATLERHAVEELDWLVYGADYGSRMMGNVVSHAHDDRTTKREQRREK